MSPPYNLIDFPEVELFDKLLKVENLNIKRSSALFYKRNLVRLVRVISEYSK